MNALLDRLIATVGLITFWGMVYAYGVVPLTDYFSAIRDQLQAEEIANALIERYREELAATQCPAPPSGVTLSSLVNQGFLPANALIGKLYSSSFQYRTGTVTPVPGTSFSRISGVTVSLTYSDVLDAQRVAGYVQVDRINGNTLSFDFPITTTFSPGLSSHIDPATGCTRKLND